MFDWFSLDVFLPGVGDHVALVQSVSLMPWLGPTNFFTWALSVMFLVFTLRATSTSRCSADPNHRQMQELQPQIKALQKKYGKDRQRMALEMQKLQREHGFNPIWAACRCWRRSRCFGAISRAAVLQRTSTGIGQLGLSPERNRQLGNYVFSAKDVGHFLDANLFGAPLGASMTQRGATLAAFADFSRPAVIAVGMPVMVLAGIATYFNSRASVARQSAEAAANPQTAIMNKLALYVFPLGVVVGGPFLPLAIIFYWFSNNIWTFGQQHYVFGMIEKEEEAKKQEAIQRRAANAPAPGAKPNRSAKAPASGNGIGVVAEPDGGAALTSAQPDGVGDEVAAENLRKPTSAGPIRLRAAVLQAAGRRVPARNPRSANADTLTRGYGRRPRRKCGG